MITPAQIRAGRALINAKQSELASAAGVSLATLNNIERGVGDPRASTLEAIQHALEGAGIRVESDGSTETVSLVTLTRPTAYDTFSASQRVLETLTKDRLLKAEKIVFFARWSRELNEHERAKRIGVLVVGKCRSILFDQSDFSLENGARIAEVAGILLAAWIKYPGALYYARDIQEDMTIAPLEEAVTRLKDQEWAAMTHPKDFLELVDDWDGHLRLFAEKDEHPLKALLSFVSSH
ncbi:helix-turn-helix domain-containing protein [Aestuariispira ectoiniformans]|uniref:helix-turn-helix domain-containing protein n=1 Tax=Aestuariispira ectoiniformans TaxID=2775080 RepID=UPI00223B8445|nr:helix-turn-helix transcriptional regulator [Aestuariispira ectoiniformans]